MRRLGVFVFYDAYGQVDKYVETLLDSFQLIFSKLVILINGKIKSLSYEKLNRYSNNIIIRENVGYDAGAYKDFFTKFLLKKELEKWDEIVLFNDTFYGPFYSWEKVFSEMEKEQIDFWGLSRYPGGGSKLSTGKDKPEHIQGYFLACNKKMFLSHDWNEFWNVLEYPRTYQEAVEKFEIYFTVYFSGKGFKNKAFTDKSHINIEYGKNPYLYYFYEFIKYDKFPILKRKSICLEHLNKVKEIVDYLKEHTKYDTGLIDENIVRLYEEKIIFPIAPFNGKKLKKFCEIHDRIFIYGHGAYGKGLARYFEYKKWHYDGFIVTEKTDDNTNVFIFKEMQINLNDGIILALGKIAFQEVYPIINKKLDDKQLYYLNYE